MYILTSRFRPEPLGEEEKRKAAIEDGNRLSTPLVNGAGTTWGPVVVLAASGLPQRLEPCDAGRHFRKLQLESASSHRPDLPDS